MSDLTSLKQLLHIVSEKRLGTVLDKNQNSVQLEDFLGRKFDATVTSSLSLIVGDVVIVVNGAVIGKTEIESEPKVYEV